jgi:hypothetical protein
MRRVTVSSSNGTRRLVDGLGLFSLGLGTAQLVAPGAMNRLVGANDDGKARAVQRWLGGLREVAAGAGLELRRKPEMWLWTRVAGDVLDLGMLAAVAGVTVADVVAALQLSGLAGGGRNGQAAACGAAIEARGWIDGQPASG